MKEVERILQAVLADVCEQRVALEAAVEKIYSGPDLREALFLDLSEMVILRTAECGRTKIDSMRFAGSWENHVKFGS
jgi:hypothetical protein